MLFNKSLCICQIVVEKASRPENSVDPVIEPPCQTCKHQGMPLSQPQVHHDVHVLRWLAVQLKRKFNLPLTETLLVLRTVRPLLSVAINPALQAQTWNIVTAHHQIFGLCIRMTVLFILYLICMAFRTTRTSSITILAVLGNVHPKR
jgi:hypothetical protein